MLLGFPPERTCCLHRGASTRQVIPQLAEHPFIFDEEREYPLAVSFAGCHKNTHWMNSNLHRPRCTFHLALVGLFTGIEAASIHFK